VLTAKFAPSPLGAESINPDVKKAAATSQAFVFIKPHAVTPNVRKLVEARFESEGFTIESQGAISAEKIDKEMLIDTHYGAIAARAMKQKPAELAVTQKAQEEFQKAFGLSWQDALSQGLVYNLVDGAGKLGCNYSELGDKYDTLQKGVTMIKFGGGFYCGKLEGIYVINGFYARMRSQFTVPGESIHYYLVSWPSEKLSWENFRSELLGATDPKAASANSMRHAIYQRWRELQLASEPNTGNNGLHASASPFEALAERANWLGADIETDYFGKAMLAMGVPLSSIKAWSDDPAVSFNGKRQSLFDLLEDLDGRDCLQKAAEIQTQNA